MNSFPTKNRMPSSYSCLAHCHGEIRSLCLKWWGITGLHTMYAVACVFFIAEGSLVTCRQTQSPHALTFPHGRYPHGIAETLQAHFNLQQRSMPQKFGSQLQLRGGRSKASTEQEDDYIVPSDEVSQGSDASEWINPDLVPSARSHSSPAASSSGSESETEEDKESSSVEIGTLGNKRKRKIAKEQLVKREAKRPKQKHLKSPKRPARASRPRETSINMCTRLSFD